MSAVPLALRLHAPAGPQPAGRPVPVEVELANAGDRPVLVVGVLDGSETGARHPRWRPQVSREGELVAAPGPAEDPLVGPLRARDFARLAPGEAVDPTRGPPGASWMTLATFSAWAPPAPGRYRYELELSTEGARPEAWLGRFNQDAERDAVLALVAEVPRVSLAAACEVEVSEG